MPNPSLAVIPAYIVYQLDPGKYTSGRLRLRVPSRRKDVEFLLSLRKACLNIPGVIDAKIYPTTGSVLIEHDTENLELLAKIASLGMVQVMAESEADAKEALFPQLTKKERHAMGFFLYSGLMLYQVTHGKVLAAGSALFQSALFQWESHKEKPFG